MPPSCTGSVSVSMFGMTNGFIDHFRQVIFITRTLVNPSWIEGMELHNTVF